MAYKNKDDQRRAWREHYARNKERYADRNKNQKKRITDFIDSLKKDMCCARCGNSYPPKAMDWHHKDPSLKKFSIANAKNLGLGFNRILQEIEKCELVCAVCHRLK